MASYTVATSKHAALESGTVDTVTLGADYQQIEVTHRGGAGDIFFTVDGSTPTVAGDNTYVVSGAGNHRIAPPTTSGTTVVKLISNGGPQYSVTALTSQRPTVSNRLVDPGGLPLANVLVRVELLVPAGTAFAAAEGTYEIFEVYSTRTQDDGSWTVTLTPNTLISPAGSSYRVSERRRSSPIDRSYQFTVPASPDPDLWVGQLVSSN